MCAYSNLYIRKSEWLFNFRLNTGDRIKFLNYMKVFALEKGSPCGFLANVMNCDTEISEFELQSCYYVHFRSNIHGKVLHIDLRHGRAVKIGNAPV